MKKTNCSICGIAYTTLHSCSASLNVCLSCKLTHLFSGNALSREQLKDNCLKFMYEGNNISNWEKCPECDKLLLPPPGEFIVAKKGHLIFHKCPTCSYSFGVEMFEGPPPKEIKVIKV